MKENKISDIQRIANVLKIRSANENSLCLKIQSVIQKLKKENDKLKFVNAILVNQNNIHKTKLKTLESQLHNKKKTDHTYNNLIKEISELNVAIMGLKKENRYYKNYIRKNKIA